MEKGKRRGGAINASGSSKEEPLAGFKRFAAALKADPRLCGDAQRDLKQKSLGDFRKQKREREADNLVDSGEDDDEGGEHLWFSPPPSFLCCASVSLAAH